MSNFRIKITEINSYHDKDIFEWESGVELEVVERMIKSIYKILLEEVDDPEAN